MNGVANPARGEAEIRLGDTVHVLRPSFAALVAAEQETGPLLELVERAAAGRLGIGEIVALFWHCLRDKPEQGREHFAEALTALGLKAIAPVLRHLIGQILAGR